MSVVWTDLTAPQGRLAVSVLFPEDTDAGQARLTAYIADGVARAAARSVATADADAYVTAWSYYRAYDALVDAMAADPGAVAQSDQNSGSWSQDQRDTFKERAAYWLGVADGFVPNTPVDDAPGIPASTSTDLVFGW